MLNQTAKEISKSDEYFMTEKQIIQARAKAANEYKMDQGVKQDVANAKQLAKEEQKTQQAVTATNRALAKQQIAVDKIENVRIGLFATKHPNVFRRSYGT